jgi:hypothetical protein
MRLLLEIIVVAALLALSWEKSFKQRISEAIGEKIPPVATVRTPTVPPREQAPRIINPVPTPSSGEWMWDPNRQATLDRPSYDPASPSLRYQDAAGRKYWIDAKGVRHYDR